MKSLILVLALGSGCLLAADAAATEGTSNGRAWKGLGGTDNQLALEMKFVYLVGLADGLQQAQGELVPILSGQDAKVADVKVAEDKAAVVIPRLLPIGVDFPTMIAALDQFYGDVQNLDVPIAMAARYERAQLEGHNVEQLEESLRRLRILYKISKELDSLEKK